MSETTDHLGRTDKDFAIEFGKYLATAADGYMDAVQRWCRGEDEGDDLMGERFRALQSAIYEFRKRADRVKGRRKP